MPNRLANENSPYLLQHANNPVDWYPWSEEALEIAKTDDKPIFLSIGYSACHWCHVMEHESFEDERIATFLNEHFVSIKVDREERPDIDHLYMQIVMAIRNGQGGWPLSAFLTPDCEVFFGGTYWPPSARVGMPGFDSILRQVLQAFREQRAAVEENATRITEWLKDSIASEAGTESEVNESLLRDAARQMVESFDFEHGGFGSAPKFPHPMDLQLLLRLATRLEDKPGEPGRNQFLSMVDLNLKKMAYGGIHDHLAGGFCRYSVDESWLVPHFEKMLYDNAQLQRVYYESALASDLESHRRIAEKTGDYLLLEMRDDAGGFHSSEDADSEGVEGKFYVWTPDEIRNVLGDELGTTFCKLYDVTPQGNFEGKSILNLPVGYGDFAERQSIEKSTLRIQMREARQKLKHARDQRIRPGRDDKVLTSWNALAIDAFAFSRPGSDVALNAIDFVLTHMVTQDGRLKHSYRNGNVKIDAFLDDYAYMINALLTAAQSAIPFRTDWLRWAILLAEKMIELFADEEHGGFYFTPVDQPNLIARYKDNHDGSVPSGNGMAAYALVRLARLTGNEYWLNQAQRSILWSIPFVKQSPLACGQMLLAIDLYLAPPQEVIFLLHDVKPTGHLPIDPRQYWLPHASVICGVSGELDKCDSFSEGLFSGKGLLGEQPTLYVCSGYQCEQPVNEPKAMAAALDALSKPWQRD